MRITKDVAKQIAYKLAEKKKALYDQSVKEYADFIVGEYEKQTPKEVIELLKKYPDWIQTASSVLINGFGFNWQNVSSNKLLIKNSNSYATLEMDAKLSHKIQVLKTKCDKLKKEWNDLVAEVQTALLGLRTFAQIQKNLPEAIPYLPKSTSMELMVNFDTLRKKLK